MKGTMSPNHYLYIPTLLRYRRVESAQLASIANLVKNTTANDNLPLYHLLPAETSTRLLKLSAVKSNSPLQASLSLANLDHRPFFMQSPTTEAILWGRSWPR